MSQPAPENTWAHPSALSAPPVSAPKSCPVNDFPAPSLRTVANDADGVGRSGDATGPANRLKTNGGTIADGADTSRSRQSAPEKTEALGSRKRI